VRRANLRHYAISSCVTALLAGCGGSQPLIGAPGAMARTLTSYSYQVLLRFGSSPHKSSRGRQPGGLLNMEGTFYGVTTSGGGANDGTVFSMSPAGEDKVLYRFRGGLDAEHPQAALIDVGGTLYGVTFSGGGGCFLYDFGCGTVFRVTTAGKEEVLHRFTGGCRSPSCTDGANPQASLIDVKGALYGTTLNGGRGSSTSYPCCGTVYSISPGGKYKVLYRFCGSSNCVDGSSPIAGLIDVNGTLYGTTLEGGARKCHIDGCGIVYSVSLSGTEKVIHRFAGGSDGAFPDGSLANVNGALYGTTARGGGSDCKKTAYSPSGCGTIYEVNTTGSESILHRFSSGTDGARPSAGLVSVNGALYGTTTSGGLESCRDDTCGTVFTLTP
jgi:uncharacterized repeat protein (TIGR03803 family)